MIKIEIAQKGVQVDGVRKLVTEVLKKRYPKATVTVSRDHTSSSRADRLADAESQVEDAASIVDELRDELQDWLDGLPENLQSGSKADELNEAISELENIKDSLDSVDMTSVSFPGMY